MKLTLLFFIFLSFHSIALAQEEEVSNLANTYENGALPDFLPYVGSALAGRCYMTTGSNKKIASVLMISFEEEGYEIAPFDAEGKRADFFDKLTYEEILKSFPLIKKLFMWVSETALGAVIEKPEDPNAYRGEIRETEKFMIMRVYIKGKINKYCNYLK